MTDHYAAIDKKTGEVQFVGAAKGKHPTDHGMCAVSYRYVKLDREPTEHDEFNGKKLVTNEEAREQRELEAKLNLMSRLEFFNYIKETLNGNLL